MTNSNESLSIHPFERTLGHGPYTYVGFGQIHLSETFGARYIGPECERGAGTCAHCGHAIMNIYVIRTGEGRQFGVGSDCILKAGMPAKELTKIERAERERLKAQRAKRKASKGDKARTELKQLMESHSVALQALPHPTAYLANTQGLTLLDYAKWVSEHSNDGGIVIALNRVKLSLNQK